MTSTPTRSEAEFGMDREQLRWIYPWTNDGPLANVLDDPELWGRIIPDVDMRRALLQVSRPQLRGTSKFLQRRVDPGKGHDFGFELMHLMQDAVRREAASQRLCQQLIRNGAPMDVSLTKIVAEYIVIWVANRPHDTTLLERFVPDATHPSILASRLDSARFRELLQGHETSPTSVDIALLACAQAMLRPAEGVLYAEALLDCNPAYWRFVVDYWESGDAEEDGSIDETDLDDPIEESPSSEAVEPRRSPAREKRSSPPRVTSSLPPAQVPSPPPPPPLPSTPAERDPAELARARLRDALARVAESGPPGLAQILAELAPEDDGVEFADVVRQLEELRVAADDLCRQAEAAGATMVWPARPPGSSFAGYAEDLRLAALEFEDERARRLSEESSAARLCERLVQPRDGQPVPALEAGELAALLRTLGAATPLSEPGRWVHPLRVREQIVSGALAGLAQLDIRRAAEIIAALPPTLRRSAAAGLRLDQLLQVADLKPHLAAGLARMLFVAAIRGERLQDVASYLEAMLYAGSWTTPQSALIGVCVRAATRGEPVVELIRELSAPDGRNGQTDARASRLLELIDLPPGMVGTYHRLRLLAQEQFFRPLRDDIAAHDTARALQRWDEFGDLEDKIAACIFALPQNAAREVGDNHVEQTRRYLCNFDEALREWVDGGGNLRTREHCRDMVTAWSALPGDDELVQQLRRVIVGISDGDLPPADLGQRYIEGRGGRICLAGDVALAPELLESWILRCDGAEVPLNVHLADLIRRDLGPSQTPADAVDRMLARQHFRAATRAAAEDPSLAGRVRREADAHRRRLEARHTDALRAAKELRVVDPPTDEYLRDLEEALAALDMVHAELWLSELPDFLRERERERDPERRAALEFLAELGESGDLRSEAREALLRRVAEARAANDERRWHIHELALERAQVPGALDVPVRALAVELDRPARWPEQSLSLRLAEAIGALVRYATAHAIRYRHYDPEPVDAVVDVLPGWLAVVLHAGLPGLRGLEPLFELAAEIRDHAPIKRVAELLAAGPAADALRAVDAQERQQLAYTRYREGDFATCVALVADDVDAELLRLCAQIMAMLYRGAPLDISWPTLRGLLTAARRRPDVTPVLTSRIVALESLADAIVRSGDISRVIDHLASATPAGYDAHALRAVLFVLALHVRVCDGKPPTEAFALAMVLPEQIFRVWARWRLGLDMTRVPAGRRVVWQMVEAAWDNDNRGNRLRVPAPGEPFPSFRCFALFAQTELLVRGGASSAGVLERNIDDLHAAFRVLRIRNDGAHALTRPGDAQREQFFGLIRRWLDQLFLACPLGTGATLRAEIAELLELLPV